jgi:hypothetical protein
LNSKNIKEKAGYNLAFCMTRKEIFYKRCLVNNTFFDVFFQVSAIYFNFAIEKKL